MGALLRSWISVNPGIFRVLMGSLWRTNSWSSCDSLSSGTLWKFSQRWFESSCLHFRRASCWKHFGWPLSILGTLRAASCQVWTILKLLTVIRSSWNGHHGQVPDRNWLALVGGGRTKVRSRASMWWEQIMASGNWSGGWLFFFFSSWAFHHFMTFWSTCLCSILRWVMLWMRYNRFWVVGFFSRRQKMGCKGLWM